MPGRRPRVGVAGGPTMSPSTAPASIDVELPGVADEDEPRLRPHRLDQPRHERERDHRRLVDDHDVVRQPVAAVVAEAAVAVGAPAEQPVQRRGVRGRAAARGRRRSTSSPAASSCTASSRRAAALPVGAASATSGGGAAGRRGLLGEQRDDPRDGRRLAGAGAAGDDGEAAQDGGRGGLALAVVVLVREQPGEPVGEHVVVDVAGRRGAERGRSAATWRSSRQ